jgi:hypothetical protein
MTLGNPYRIIYEIRFDLEGGGALTLPLTRDGQAAPRPFYMRSPNDRYGVSQSQVAATGATSFDVV